MSNESHNTYWKSLAERDGPRSVDDVNPQDGQSQPSSHAISRRRFLEATGFTLSFAAMQGCGRTPTETALPFVAHPAGVIPGRSLSYASTCGGCPAGCGLLASVRDGRPLKMEGMPEHPLSRGGLCAVGQALPLGLYDSHRLGHPLQDGEPSEWVDVDAAISQALGAVEQNGGAVRFVTPTVTSPTLQASIDAFLERFADARQVTFDAVSSSAILDAHEQTHGVRALPHYQLGAARVIVSFGADFLGTWISPVEFTAAWRSRRVPTAERPEMSYHVQLEGRLSLTGSNADRRLRVAPAEFGAVLSQLYASLSRKADASATEETPVSAAVPEEELAALADRLWEARGESVVLCDSQDVAVQTLVNGINQLLGNYGRTLDVATPSLQRQGSDQDVGELIEELQAGHVAALFVAGTDLTHNLPGRDTLSEAISGVDLVVSLSERLDDFSSLATFVCPDHHALESWGDAEPVAGLVSLSQPLLAPLGKTRSILESLARWSGREESAYEILRTHWEQSIHPQSNSMVDFGSFWDQAVHDGFVQVVPRTESESEFQADAVAIVSSPPQEDLSLTLYTRVGSNRRSTRSQSRGYRNFPTRSPKITWDNYVSVSPKRRPRELEVDRRRRACASRPADDERRSSNCRSLVQRGQHDQRASRSPWGTESRAPIGSRTSVRQWLEGTADGRGRRTRRSGTPLR